MLAHSSKGLIGMPWPVVVRATVVGLLSVLLALGSAQAALVKRLDLPGLVGRAAVIGHGRVASVRCLRVGGRIVSEITLSGDRILKGQPAAELKFRVLGGALDGLAQVVPGEPSFAVGEEAVVFLQHTADGARVVGMSQGKWQVIGQMATQRLDGLTFPELIVGEANERAPERVNTRFETTLPVATLEAMIKAVVETPIGLTPNEVSR